jgi:hypothetical protein
MPEAPLHCKRLTVEVSGELDDVPCRQVLDGKASDALKALVGIGWFTAAAARRYESAFARSDGQQSVNKLQYARWFRTLRTNRLIRRGRTAGNRA